MKRFWLLLLICITVGKASAQGAQVLELDGNTLEFSRRVLFPGFALFLLGSFIIAAIKLVLAYLLKRQIMTSAISEKVVERILPGPQDEQNKVVKWISLLVSTGSGLLLCNRYLPLGVHSLIIMLFSTALGFLVYFLYLQRQVK